jgi:uncharacterized protein YegJ (DUF2314 family)
MTPIAQRFVLGALLVTWLPLTVRSAVKDHVIGVSAEDKEMNQAIEAARAKLPHFWKVRADPKRAKEFCLKVRIVDGETVEHFWCTNIESNKGVISGLIGNDPELVKNVKLGQRIVIKESAISDWLYLKDEKMIGNYTVRPLMKSMSAEERAFLQARLGELPKD